MRLGREMERKVLELIEKRPELCVVFPDEAYRPDGKILIHRGGTAMFLHRYLWDKVNPGQPLGSAFLLPNPTIKHCFGERCVNPRHRWPSETSKNLVAGARRRAPRPVKGTPSASALNAVKTHCPHGHEYTPENTYTWEDKKGRVHRKCVACTKARAAERRNRPALLDVGTILEHHGPIPAHALAADGQALSSSDYPELFEVIGTTYGEGYGDGTFNLPKRNDHTIIIVKPNGVSHGH